MTVLMSLPIIIGESRKFVKCVMLWYTDGLSVLDRNIFALAIRIVADRDVYYTVVLESL